MLYPTIKITLSHKSYLRDPESTDLGRRIITESIKLINELGFEQFTFKKMALEIGSTEASVYRYFENKHKLLVYLVSWYWAWIDYTIHFQVNNLHDPREKLSRALRVIAVSNRNDPSTLHIDEAVLHRIVIAESPKVYLTKDVDADNKEGFFMEYKRLCKHLAEIVLEASPTYPYPNTLVSTVLEATHQQLYFAEHLPSLTNIKSNTNSEQATADFLQHLLFSAIDGYKK